MVLRNVRALCVLFEMVSLKTAPVHGEDDNSPNKRFILSPLAWEGPKEWFSSTKLSLGTTDSQSFQSRHAEVKVQGMLFLPGADSSAVKSPSKENTLKSMPLKMTSPKNRALQTKMVNGKPLRRQPPAARLPVTIFTPSFSLVKYCSPCWGHQAAACLLGQRYTSRLHRTIFIQSRERQTHH